MRPQHAHTFIHLDVRTISLKPGLTAPEGNRAVRLDGTYPTATTQPVYGVTISARNVPGTIVNTPIVIPNVVTTNLDYKAGDRVYLAANQSPTAVAGIYQFHSEHTAATLVAADLPVFLIQAGPNGQLAQVVNQALSNPSTTPLFPVGTTYQSDIAVCLAGELPVETGGAIAAGAQVAVDNQGRVIAASAGDYILGIALNSCTAAGQFIKVTLRPAQ